MGGVLHESLDAGHRGARAPYGAGIPTAASWGGLADGGTRP